MTDQPEKRGETEDVEADFEGHKHANASSDAQAVTDDDGADFEGHMHKGPEKRLDGKRLDG
jgi:hypothetical protein